MEIDKAQLAQVLEAQGDTDAQDKLAGLPERIDLDRDADALAGIGLDKDTLRTKLAAGGIGGNLWA
jgi:hypothetical protein